MALTGLFLTSLIVAISLHLAASNAADTKPVGDAKKREVVDKAFLEQKDVLLDMLESKLKEVRDSKKKKKSIHNENVEGAKCDQMSPSNLELKLKSNGLSAVGEAEVSLKFGSSGKSLLNLEANGISNVGKAHLELDDGDGGLYIPGLNNLILGKSLLCNNRNNEITAKHLNEDALSRRNTNGTDINNPAMNSIGHEESNSTVSSSDPTSALNASTTIPVTSSLVAQSNAIDSTVTP